MSNKPPLGLRPRWLVLSDRADEIKAAVQRYEAQDLLCPVEWLIELQDIKRQQAILDPPQPEPDSEPVVTPPAPAAPTVPQPRRFVSISRTIVSDEDHILDAIADDGTAWCLRMSFCHSWRLISPLPAREVPANA